MSDILQTALRQFLGQDQQPGGNRCRQFAVLPSRHAPRCLVPLGETSATIQGLRIYTPYRFQARFLKAALSQVIKTGWRGWARDPLAIDTAEPLKIETLVSEVTGERAPVFALSLGTPGKYRKLTIQVMRPDGDILGFVKLPLTAPATERVRHEAAVLERLNHFAPLQPYIPRVLYAGEWRDGYLLFQSPMDGRSGPSVFSHLQTRFLETLWSAQAVSRPAPGLIAQVGSEWESAAVHLDSQWRSLGNRALQLARCDLEGTTIACGISHGDFAPWNTRVRDGKLRTFDWESAEWEAPLEWDVFHFDSQVTSLLRKDSGCRFRYSAHRQSRGVFLLYLLRTLAQALEEGSDHPEATEYRRRELERELGKAALGNVTSATNVKDRNSINAHVCRNFHS